MKSIIVAFFIMLTSGCSTVHTRFSDEEVKGIYPATKKDIQIVTTPINHDAWLFTPVIQLFVKLGFVVDIPISLASDTIMLPIDVFNGEGSDSDDQN